MTKAPEVRQYGVGKVSKLLGRLVFQIHHAGRANDPEAVHDLRVSIRRFNQGMRVFGEFFPGREMKKVRRRLREIMKAAAKVRDRDVALELYARARLSAAAPLAVATASQREESGRELRDLLKQFETRNYSSRWRAWLHL